MTSTASENDDLVKKQGIELTLRQNDIRALICCAVTGTVVSGINWNDIQPLDLLILIGVLSYTVISYLFVRKYAKIGLGYKYFQVISTLDAGVIGWVITFSNFSVLPTILFFTMIQFNSLIIGGLRKWAQDNVAFALGIGLSFLIRQPKIAFGDSFEISSISLISIFSYFCAYAIYVHNRIRKLDLANRKLTNELTLYKLRTYKLSRYLTPTVWQAVSEGREKSLATERKPVTVFFSDIKGFSALAEQLEAEALNDLLNSYLTEMAKIATKHKGTIDKFMGDAVMVIFGDSKSGGLKVDALHCMAMAIEMRRKMKELQTVWYNEGIKEPLQIRMGINTGYCTVGSFGTSHYMDYTVLGTHVNLASRLESAAQPGEILVSHETWSLVKDVIMCRDKGEITAKGFSHPIKVYQVVDFRKDLGGRQTYFEQITEGFSMHMDLEKIRNYDRGKLTDYLRDMAERLRDKIR